jgi:hypothetical protein
MEAESWWGYFWGYISEGWGDIPKNSREGVYGAHRYGNSPDSLCPKCKFLLLLLGCHEIWQAVEIYLIGRERFQDGMWSDRVAEFQVAADRTSGLAGRGVCAQIDFLILD